MGLASTTSERTKSWQASVVVAVAVGGALGALCRVSADAAVSAVLGSKFPVGILLVNVLGCFLMGVLQGAIKRSGKPYTKMAALLGTGFLGAFTTFSAFAMDTFILYHSGQIILSSLNVILNMCLCMAAVGIGYQLILKRA